MSKKPEKVFKKFDKINNVVKLLLNFRKNATFVKTTPTIKLCFKILNQKLRKLGVLNQNQSISNKVISSKDFLKRKVSKILKRRLIHMKTSEIIELIKKKKIFLNNSVLRSSDVFLSIENEKFLEIKI